MKMTVFPNMHHECEWKKYWRSRKTRGKEDHTYRKNFTPFCLLWMITRRLPWVICDETSQTRIVNLIDLPFRHLAFVNVPTIWIIYLRIPPKNSILLTLAYRTVDSRRHFSGLPITSSECLRKLPTAGVRLVRNPDAKLPMQGACMQFRVLGQGWHYSRPLRNLRRLQASCNETHKISWLVPSVWATWNLMVSAIFVVFAWVTVWNERETGYSDSTALSPVSVSWKRKVGGLISRQLGNLSLRNAQTIEPNTVWTPQFSMPSASAR